MGNSGGNVVRNSMGNLAGNLAKNSVENLAGNSVGQGGGESLLKKAVIGLNLAFGIG